MRVIHKQTGQLGDIPDDRFDPALFEVPQPAPQALPPITTRPQKGMGEQIIDGGKAVANFLMPKITAAGSAVVNTAGMAKDYMDYAGSRSVSDREAQAKSYTERKNKANEALKQFGFDANKEGNQFDPVKYGTGTLAGAGEAASFMSPTTAAGKTVAGRAGQRFVANAIPGAINAIDQQEYENVDSVDDAVRNLGKGIVAGTGGGVLSGTLGTGGEYVAKGAGKALKGGAKMAFNTVFDEGKKGAENAVKSGVESLGEQALKRRETGTSEGLFKKASKKLVENEQKLQDSLSNTTATVDMNDVFKAVEPQLKKWQEAGNSETAERVLKRLSDIADENGMQVPASKANEIKRSLYLEADKAFGTEKATAVEGIKDIARGLKEGIEKVAPDAANINKELSYYGRIKDAMLPQMGKEARGKWLNALNVVTMAGGLVTSVPTMGASMIVPALTVAAQNPFVQTAAGRAMNATADVVNNKITQKTGQQLGQSLSRAGSDMVTNAYDKGQNQQNTQNSQNPPMSITGQEQYQSEQPQNGGSLQHSSNTIPQVPPVSTPDTLPPITTSQMITIQNPETGETKQVRPDEMEQYGLNPDGTPPEQTGIPSEEEFKAELIRQMQAGNTKGVNSMIAMYDKLYKQDAADKPLSAEAQKVKTKANTAIRAVDRIVEKITTDPNVLASREFNPLDQTGRQLDADLRSAIDIIGYFRTGATLTPDQRKDYLIMFPQVMDSPETRKAKIAAIKEELQGYAGIQPDVAVPATTGYMPEITTSY